MLQPPRRGENPVRDTHKAQTTADPVGPKRRPEPPDGEVQTSAILADTKNNVLIDTGGLNLGDMYSQKTITGDVNVSLLASDPHTGEPVRLDGVRVRPVPGTALRGIPEGQRFVLRCRSYDAFKERDISQMEAEPVGKKPVTQNQSIPREVKYKDTSGGFGSRPTPACKRYNRMENVAKGHLGLIHDRDDLTILQGSNDGRSPGVLVQQSDGKVYMFDVTGKQYISLDADQTKIQSGLVEFGGADMGKTAAMLPVPMKENKVLDMVPNGTILNPQPKIIINYAKAMNTILTVVDLINLGVACAKAVKTIYGPSRTKRQDLADIVEESKRSSSTFYYGEPNEDDRKGYRYHPEVD